MNMLRTCIFLCSLILSEALTLPFRRQDIIFPPLTPEQLQEVATQLMQVLVPLKSMLMMFKSTKLMLVMGIVMQQVQLLGSLLNQKMMSHMMQSMIHRGSMIHGDSTTSQLLSVLMQLHNNKKGSSMNHMKGGSAMTHIKGGPMGNHVVGGSMISHMKRRSMVDLLKGVPMMNPMKISTIQQMMNNMKWESMVDNLKVGPMKWGSVKNIYHDSCLRRLVCEINMNSDRRRKRHAPSTVETNKIDHDKAEPKIIIKLKLTGLPSSHNPCQKWAESCPYSSQDMLQALHKLPSIWHELKIPKL